MSQEAQPMRTCVTMYSGHTQGRREPERACKGSRILGTQGPPGQWRSLPCSCHPICPPASPGLLLGQDAHLARPVCSRCRRGHGLSSTTTKLPLRMLPGEGSRAFYSRLKDQQAAGFHTVYTQHTPSRTLGEHVQFYDVHSPHGPGQGCPSLQSLLIPSAGLSLGQESVSESPDPQTPPEVSVGSPSAAPPRPPTGAQCPRCLGHRLRSRGG